MTYYDSFLVINLHALAIWNEPVRLLTIALAFGLVFAVPAALIALWFRPLSQRRRRRRVLLASAVSLVLGAIVTGALLVVADRPPPSTVLTFTPLIPAAAKSTIPSVFVMIGATLAAPLLGRFWRYGVPLLLITLLAGAARVAAGVEWPTDVLGTAIVGLLVGAAASSLTKQLLNRISPTWLARLHVNRRSNPSPSQAPAAGSRRRVATSRSHS